MGPAFRLGGQFHQQRSAVSQLEIQLAAAAHDLLGRSAIDRSAKTRIKSMPPPETMMVLNPLARK
jgi:hypothetical protein